MQRNSLSIDFTAIHYRRENHSRFFAVIYSFVYKRFISSREIYWYRFALFLLCLHLFWYPVNYRFQFQVIIFHFRRQWADAVISANYGWYIPFCYMYSSLCFAHSKEDIPVCTVIIDWNGEFITILILRLEVAFWCNQFTVNIAVFKIQFIIWCM